MRSILKHGRERGFTLIEAMTAGVVLSILTLGLMGMWTTAGATTDSLIIREKAIWTLNAHMERLMALHQFTEFGDTGNESSTGYGYGAGFSDNRRIFGLNTDASMAPPGTLQFFKLIVGSANGILESQADDFETRPGYPVYYVGGQNSDDRRNYVWIDRERSIIGRLSWEQSDLEINTCGADNEPGGGNDPCMCFDFSGGPDGDRCRAIQLALEFPLRWEPNENAVIEYADTEVLTLRTIVGRRL